MKSVTLLSAAAVGLKLASAAEPWYTCDGYRRPDYDDCSAITEPWRGSEDILHEDTDLTGDNCLIWTEGNCYVSHCWSRPSENDTPWTITAGYAQEMAGGIEYRCNTLLAGGQWNGASDYIEMFNNERPTKRSRSKRDASGNIVPTKMTIEEWEQLKNDTTGGAHRNNAKRQVDGDDVVSIDFSAKGIRNPSQNERGPRLASGVGYTYSTTESRTYSVTTSISLGGAWNIFTASVGTDIEESETFSVTEGLEFDVDCAERGQVTFWPFYDLYEVTFWPSATKATIWVPVVTGARTIAGEISVACMGSSGE